MWMIFGALAILSALANVLFYVKGKKPEIFRFVSLSATACTMCSFYGQNKVWVLAEDWSALSDVVPTVSTLLWILVGVSIVINAISLIKR